MARGWDKLIFKVHCNPNHSGILEFRILLFSPKYQHKPPAGAPSKKCPYHRLKLSFILLPSLILMLEEHFIFREKIWKVSLPPDSEMLLSPGSLMLTAFRPVGVCFLFSLSSPLILRGLLPNVELFTVNYLARCSCNAHCELLAGL